MPIWPMTLGSVSSKESVESESELFLKFRRLAHGLSCIASTLIHFLSLINAETGVQESSTLRRIRPVWCCLHEISKELFFWSHQIENHLVPDELSNCCQLCLFTSRLLASCMSAPRCHHLHYLKAYTARANSIQHSYGHIVSHTIKTLIC